MDYLALNSMMYLTVLVSVRDILMLLQSSLPETDSVDLTVIVKAMLDKLFFDEVSFFGNYSGPFGAYRIQVPENIALSDFDIDMKLHEIEVHLLDILSGTLPNMAVDFNQHYYYYPKGENQADLYVYVPIDPQTCPADFKSKLLPLDAIRHTHRPR